MGDGERRGTPVLIAQVDGARLRELRLRRGWGQARLAEHAGVPQSTISRIERTIGPAPVRPITLQRLIEAFDLAERSDLLGDNGDPADPDEPAATEGGERGGEQYRLGSFQRTGRLHRGAGRGGWFLPLRGSLGVRGNPGRFGGEPTTVLVRAEFVRSPDAYSLRLVAALHQIDPRIGEGWWAHIEPIPNGQRSVPGSIVVVEDGGELYAAHVLTGDRVEVFLADGTSAIWDGEAGQVVGEVSHFTCSIDVRRVRWPGERP